MWCAMRYFPMHWQLMDFVILFWAASFRPSIQAIWHIEMGFCCKCKFCRAQKWEINTDEQRGKIQFTCNQPTCKYAEKRNMLSQSQMTCHCDVLCVRVRVQKLVLCHGNRLEWSMNRIDFTMTDIGLCLNDAHTIFRTQKENKMLIAHSRHSRVQCVLVFVRCGAFFFSFFFCHFSLLYTMFAQASALAHHSLCFFYLLHIMNR